MVRAAGALGGLMLIRYFLVCLLLGFGNMAKAAIEIGGKEGAATNIGMGIEFLEDDSGRLNINSLTSPDLEWRTYQGNVFTKGYSASDWWLRFDLKNIGPQQTYYLEVAYSVLDYIDVHIFRNGELKTSHLMGDKLPFSDRPVNHRLFLVPLSLHQEEVVTVYVRAKSSSSVQVPIIISEFSAYQEKDTGTTLIHGLYLGGMLIISIYNLLIFVALRDKSYLYYVAYVTSMMMFLASLNGWSFQYLWPESTWWNDTSILVFLNGVVLFGLLFATHFLGLKEFGPKFNLLRRAWISISMTIMFSYALVPYSLSIRYTIPFAALSCLFVMSMGFYALRKGQKSALIYIISWAGIVIGGVLLASNKMQLVPKNVFTDQAIQFGSLLEVMLLSFGLAQRINHEKAQRLQAQEDALAIQQQATQELEERVAERTKDLETANRRLKELSDTDQLTGLKNRRYLDKYLTQEIKSALRYEHPLSILLLDIDHFKRLNDNYGHLIGDICLQEVSKRFSHEMRSPMDLSARYGGEEFCVVLPETPLNGALVVAERIRKSINDFPVTTKHFCQRISVSIGVYSAIPKEEDSITTFLERADKALYMAKTNGRNRVES